MVRGSRFRFTLPLFWFCSLISWSLWRPYMASISLLICCLTFDASYPLTRQYGCVILKIVIGLLVCNGRYELSRRNPFRWQSSVVSTYPEIQCELTIAPSMWLYHAKRSRNSSVYKQDRNPRLEDIRLYSMYMESLLLEPDTSLCENSRRVTALVSSLSWAEEGSYEPADTYILNWIHSPSITWDLWSGRDWSNWAFCMRITDALYKLADDSSQMDLTVTIGTSPRQHWIQSGVDREMWSEIYAFLVYRFLLDCILGLLLYHSSDNGQFYLRRVDDKGDHILIDDD